MSRGLTCNRCLSPLMLWVRLPLWARCTTLCDKVCPWLAVSRWFSPGNQVSSTNKTDRHDIAEILLKVALNTINQTQPNLNFSTCMCSRLTRRLAYILSVTHETYKATKTTIFDIIEGFETLIGFLSIAD